MDHPDPTEPPRWRRGPLHEGTLKHEPDDFRVEEIPVYEPSGFGEHLFVKLRKVDLSTPEAVKRLCRALDTPFKSAGWAGMKDRRAVTTQWISLHGVTPEQSADVSVEGVTVLEAVPHEKKLKTGHLRGNRFDLRVRSVSDPDALVQAFGEIGVVPAYFGEQRFGRDNLDRARAWLVDGGRSPRDRVQRRFLVSALQSAVFNSIVADRVTNETLTTVIDGDVLQTERGGMFDAAEDPDPQARLDAGEVTPTAPLPGKDVRWATGDAEALERAACERWSIDDGVMARMGKLGRGTRRATFVRPVGLEASRDGDDVRVTFSLPAGRYATVVVREALADGPESHMTP